MDNNQNNEANAMTNTDDRQGISWQLIGLSPSLADLTIDIDKSLSIGRSDNNDLVLATPQISRQHAKINRVGDKLYVQDLGSSNGTFVNGDRITTEAQVLQTTDELAFADLMFLVVNDDFDADSFLDSLEQIQQPASVIAPTRTDQKLPVASETVTAETVVERPVVDTATPVIDVVTVQDFVPKNQPTAPVSEQTATPSEVRQIEATKQKAEAIPITPTQQTTPSPIADELVDKTQPTVASVGQATTSPVSIVQSAPLEPAAKKNASLAIIIVIVIALIVLATLFMK